MDFPKNLKRKRLYYHAMLIVKLPHSEVQYMVKEVLK